MNIARLLEVIGSAGTLFLISGCVSPETETVRVGSGSLPPSPPKLVVKIDRTAELPSKKDIATAKKCKITPEQVKKIREYRGVSHLQIEKMSPAMIAKSLKKIEHPELRLTRKNKSILLMSFSI